jgi:hypothetical protein
MTETVAPVAKRARTEDVSAAFQKYVKKGRDIVKGADNETLAIWEASLGPYEHNWTKSDHIMFSRMSIAPTEKRPKTPVQALLVLQKLALECMDPTKFVAGFIGLWFADDENALTTSLQSFIKPQFVNQLVFDAASDKTDSKKLSIPQGIVCVTKNYFVGHTGKKGESDKRTGNELENDAMRWVTKQNSDDKKALESVEDADVDMSSI